MSQIKLLHSGGNGVILSAPDSSPASDRTLKLPGDTNSTVDTLNRAGNILQVVSTTKTDTFSHNTQTPTLITGLTATITPSSSSNKVKISVDISCSPSNSTYTCWFFLYKGGSEISGATGDAGQANQDRAFKSCRGSTTNDPVNVSGTFLDSPSTTSATTYQVYMSVESGITNYINMQAQNANVVYNPRTVSSITLEEVAA